MSLKIIWSNFAESELDNIFECYVEFASVKIAEKIIHKILTEPNRLLTNVEMFLNEHLFINRSENYRYLVCAN